MAFKKSHKWILEPVTKIERKHILDLVRENNHMVMVHPKKYFDSDNCRFDIDKIETINSHSLSEFCDNGVYTHPPYSYRNDNQYDHIPYFVPKDNNFDEECRRDEEERLRKEQEKKRQSYLQELSKQQEEFREYGKSYEQILAEAQRRVNYIEVTSSCGRPQVNNVLGGFMINKK